MKINFYLMILIFVCQCFGIAQEKSDYAILKKFQTNIESISANIDKATTAQECADINVKIDGLEKEFSKDSLLLEKANYPDGYKRAVERLRVKLIIRQKDLGIIESQVIRIAELESKIRELSDQIAIMSSENEKLIDELRLSSKEALDSLRNIVSKLQDGLKQRDALIFALVDTLFLQYDKNISDMKDIEKQSLRGKIEYHGIFNNIKRSIMDNVDFLESTQLKGTDIVTLARQQHRFRSQWKGLSPKLASLYLQGKSKKNELPLIDSMISIWENKVDEAIWRSLDKLFEEKGFVLKEFKNGDEFYRSFISFLDEQIEDPRKEMVETRYKLFTNFNENLWISELNPKWLPALVELNKLTEMQKKDIQEKVEKWKSTVTPGLSWLSYILIILGAVLLVVILIWFFRKASTPAEEEG